VVAAATGAAVTAGADAAIVVVVAAAAGVAVCAGAGVPIVVVVVHPATNIAIQARASSITMYFGNFIVLRVASFT
jgi:hypothetical protein